MAVELASRGPGLVSDANPALITLYQAVAGGWDPPQSVTEEQYAAGRALPDTDPMKAFLGFGCSFGGKWFGGFARSKKDRDRNFVTAARNVLLRDVDALVSAGCEIARVNFLDIEPAPTDMVLYFDPPYANTTGYGGTGKFDHTRFCERVRQWSEYTDVFVSEYALPAGRPILEFTHDMPVAGGGTQKDAQTERLCRFGPALPWVAS